MYAHARLNICIRVCICTYNRFMCVCICAYIHTHMYICIHTLTKCDSSLGKLSKDKSSKKKNFKSLTMLN